MLHCAPRRERELVQALAIDQLHGQEPAPLVLAYLVHGDDVRVGEGSDRARLADESLGGQLAVRAQCRRPCPFAVDRNQRVERWIESIDALQVLLERLAGGGLSAANCACQGAGVDASGAIRRPGCLNRR